MEMIAIIVATVIVTLTVVFSTPKLIRSIKNSGVGLISDDEKRVIKTVPLKWRKPMLRYLRTLEAPRELQDHMASNTTCLKEVSKFMKKEYGNVVRLNPP